MLVLADIVNEQGRAAFRQERLAEYLDKAVVFLRSNFAPFAASVHGGIMRDGVLATYRRAQAMQIRSEVDHLRYLSLTVMLGFGFEADPLRGPVMDLAGAYKDHAALTMPLPLAPLVAAAEAYLKHTAEDLARPQTLVRGFARQRQTQEPHPIPLASQLQQLWPKRVGLLAAGQLDAFLRLAEDTGRSFQLTDRDAVSLALLFPYFGSYLSENPFFPWAKAALTRLNRDAEGPMPELGQGVLSYLKCITTEAT